MSRSVASPSPSISGHLLANGLAAVRAGAELLGDDPSDQELRTSLREISSGIELVMKAVLAAEHWTLIFDDPRKAKRSQLADGDFKSVGFEECTTRLEQTLSIELSEKQKKHLGRMRLKRNRLEHLGMLDQPEALRSALGGSMHALVDLLRLAEERGLLPTGSPAPHTALAADLVKIEEFVDARWAEIGAPRGSKQGLPCPKCTQEAGRLEDGGLKCLFCGGGSSAAEAAEAYVEISLGISRSSGGKDIGQWPIFFCPSCSRESLVDSWDIDETMRCFGCDGRFSKPDLTFCEQCENPFVVDADDPEKLVCKDCWDELKSRDEH